MSASRGPTPSADRLPAFGTARLAEETRERFLREIVARVPLDRIVEVYCFTPMRQGGMETCVAVVAARPDTPANDEAHPVHAAPGDAGMVVVAESEVSAPASTLADEPALVDEPTLAGAIDAAEADAVAAHDAAHAGDVAGDAAPAVDAAAADDATHDATEEPRVDADAPALAGEHATEHATEHASDAAPEHEDALAAEPLLELPPGAAARVASRHTIFTARYRLVLKGPDRGKWDIDVVEEADAPLITLEAVVRGVQHRAGDAAGPERLDAETVARAVGPRPTFAAGGTRSAG